MQSQYGHSCWLDVKPQTNKVFFFAILGYLYINLSFASCKLHLYGLMNLLGSWDPQNRSEGSKKTSQKQASLLRESILDCIEYGDYDDYDDSFR